MNLLKEILKPRSYEGSRLIKEGDFGAGFIQIATATILRTGISYCGILLAGFDARDGLKAAIAANLAITTSIVAYYMLD